MKTKFNFNSQICTTREQSERLLALGLKKDTADMYYWYLDLKPRNQRGYLFVVLYDGELHKRRPIHRIVADAFIPNPENKPCVDHIDTNRTNNNVDNLRWVTYKENANNPLSLKAQREGISKRKNLNNKLN